MMRAAFAVAAFATMAVLFALAGGGWARKADVAAAASLPPSSPASADVSGDLLYGRVTSEGGTIYEGRLRFGGDEEAFWGHYFNAVKGESPWAAHVPRERLPRVRDSFGIFGREIAVWTRPIDLRRPFMARFGDIARLEAHGRDLRVTLKSGTVVDLDRFAADDFADGVRVWDNRRGIVDLDEWRIRTIEFLSTPHPSVVSDRLYGTVRTSNGDFTGFIQWDRKQSVGGDELEGRSADGLLSLRFRTIRSITRRSRDSSLVTLLDGREITMSGSREVGFADRGIYVDDRRYGRVLVSWDAFERADFNAGITSPAYGDFLPGRQLTGTVITRSGRRLAGRLIYDLDESETTETLDAPSQGIDYIIPFALIVSIEPRIEERGAQHARVILDSGEELRLDPAGDLAEGNAGMLIFVHERPEYVPWTDVERVEFARLPE